jgi:hypothetical protein
MDTPRCKPLLGRQPFYRELTALQCTGEATAPGLKLGELLGQNVQ